MKIGTGDCNKKKSKQMFMHKKIIPQYVIFSIKKISNNPNLNIFQIHQGIATGCLNFELLYINCVFVLGCNMSITEI